MEGTDDLITVGFYPFFGPQGIGGNGSTIDIWKWAHGLIMRSGSKIVIFADIYYIGIAQIQLYCHLGIRWIGSLNTRRFPDFKTLISQSDVQDDEYIVLHNTVYGETFSYYKSHDDQIKHCYTMRNIISPRRRPNIRVRRPLLLLNFYNIWRSVKDPDSRRLVSFDEFYLNLAREIITWVSNQ